MILEARLNEAGECKAVEFEYDETLGADCTPMQWHHFLQSFKLWSPIILYRYTDGGNVRTIILVCKIAAGINQSKLTAQSFSMIERNPEAADFSVPH